MYLELSEIAAEEEALKTQVHRFAAEVLRPASLELDSFADPAEVIADGSPFWQVFEQYYSLRYHHASLPAALGGMNLGAGARHIIAEEMGWGSADFAVALGVTSLPFSFASMSGHEDLIERVVKPFVEDSRGRYIGCWAITEPDHGSDLLMVGTKEFHDPRSAGGVRAENVGSGWIINGQKSAWVSNGTIATHALVFLSLEPERGAAGGGVAVVPLEQPGVTRGRPLNKLGQRALNQGEIFFREVHVPANYMLVGEEAYPHVLESVLAGANAFMGATFTGVARAAFEEALDYARNRVQGGTSISNHQAVQLKLMEMFSSVECARALSRAVFANAASASPPSTAHAMASKVFCTEAAFRVASEAVQLHGGYGLTKGAVVEKLFRDARAALIEDGTNEVLSLAAARKVIDQYVAPPAHSAVKA
jgi:alkylation response protein AidB-like acyl-CoA dehydrogenase